MHAHVPPPGRLLDPDNDSVTLNRCSRQPRRSAAEFENLRSLAPGLAYAFGRCMRSARKYIPNSVVITMFPKSQPTIAI